VGRRLRGPASRRGRSRELSSIHYFPEEFLKENRELVRKINLRLGYRFQLQEMSWSDKPPVNGKSW